MKKNCALGGSLLLFLTACIWGLAFVSQSKGMESMQPFTFNGIRSLMGAAAVFPLAWFRVSRIKKTGGAKKNFDWKTALTGGIFCGILYTAASTFQQFGIAYTTVGKAGFITTLYIIFVPILGIFLKKKVPGIVWISVVMAAAGMYLLCMTESFSLAPGDSMVFVCAILFAMHILTVDYLVTKTEGTVLSCMQLLVCGIVCTTLAIFKEKPTMGQLAEGLIPLLYAGILSCGVAYTLQMVGQKKVNPTAASLILSLESVVAALAGYFAYRIGMLQTDQTLTMRQIAGCVIVFAAVILVQLPIGKKNKT